MRLSSAWTDFNIIAINEQLTIIKICVGQILIMVNQEQFRRFPGTLGGYGNIAVNVAIPTMLAVDRPMMWPRG